MDTITPTSADVMDAIKVLKAYAAQDPERVGTDNLRQTIGEGCILFYDEVFLGDGETDIPDCECRNCRGKNRRMLAAGAVTCSTPEFQMMAAAAMMGVFNA